ncbi:MAG: dihydrodipicolinate synthase family protein, partial [bacterium]
MASSPLFTGTYTALVTPFGQDGNIDDGAFRNLLEAQIAAGVEGVVILGTTGESPTLTDQEGAHLLAETVRIAKGKLRIIAGAGSNDTQKALSHAEQARSLGADALIIVNPYYNKPTQEGLYRHFSLLADRVDLPQIVYNIR